MSDQLNSQSRNYPKLPNQRWEIALENTELSQELAQATGLSPLLGQVLINRGIENLEQAEAYLDPDSLVLPSPMDEFNPDLAISIDLLEEAIANHAKIAICGDYDADGMTSTALLLRALRWLGADVDYAIPSRMTDGYGINKRIVEESAHNGVQLILTVDNGISAFDAIETARELGMDVIVTDHHDLPEQLPEANAILNPKMISASSPYRGLAGVGVAYILAVSLAQKLGKLQGLTTQLLELFTLGTIADLAPLTGVNRRWLKRGLQLLPNSQLEGVKALIQIAGLQQEIATETAVPNAIPKQKSLKPEHIGFRLGPRINAIGRIGDPRIVIDLLTTDDPGIALEKAMQCEQINQRRQQMCEQIEKEAVAWCEQSEIDLHQERVLVVVQPSWHHGVIGIVASRLVERYGVPVFIGTYEDEDLQHIRGSARSIPEFNVFEALQFSHDLLGKYGGHKAAGGFSLEAKNLDELRSRLSKFAHKCLEPQHLKPLINIDVQANLSEINLDLYKQIDHLHPCGIDNADPVFWTPNVRVVDQQTVGKNHIKLTLTQAGEPTTIKAIAWRLGEYFPLPSRVDIAYKLKENNWNGNINIELELVGIRLSTTPLPVATNTSRKAEFYYKERPYFCILDESINELRIRNSVGEVLAIQKGQRMGLYGKNRETAREIDVTQPHFSNVIKAALQALETIDNN